MTKRTAIGTIVTILWIGAGLIYAYFCRDLILAMEPNEFGDFLAGAFSPLAFLWLIIGYMQQGEELSLNTEALRLQSDELRQSVEQQRQLVAATREQIDEEREKYKNEQDRMLAAAEPKFMFAHFGPNLVAGPTESKIRIANTGGCSRPLSVLMVQDDGQERHVFTTPILDTGAEKEFTVQNSWFNNDTRSRAFVTTHRDSMGQDGRKKFLAKADENHRILFKKIES